MSEVSNIQIVGVVGAGLMGAGIAQVLAASGYSVLLHDQDGAAITRAIGQISAQFDQLVTKGRMTAEAASLAKGALNPAAALSELAPCDLVIEAILERLDVKQALFVALEDIVAPTAILASNTSSLSIAAISRPCRVRERICGMHFFNPVPLMKLVEVIPGPSTSDEVTQAARAVVARMGKIDVLARDSHGFLVNLGGRAYYTEALHVEQEGVATPEQIDRIMTLGAGFRMGPFQLMDLTGIDTNHPVTTFIYQGHLNDPRLKTTPLHGLMVEAGRFGRKSGRGFYDYAQKTEAPAAPVLRAEPLGFAAELPQGIAGLEGLASQGLSAATGGDLPILIAPFGEDATSMAVRLGLDPARVVAIDPIGLARGVATVMTPPVPSRTVEAVIDWLRAVGFHVERIKDSAGFVAQRIVAMIVNLGAEMAQTRVATPTDIEKGLTLGLNYPQGPLAWGDALGADRVLAALCHMQAISGSDRYRPSLWLRRRALLGTSLLSEG